MQNTFKKRVLFLGMPDLALVCLDRLYQAGVNIVGVVPPAKSENTHHLLVNQALGMGLRVIEYEKSLKESVFLNKIKALEADIAVVCSYNKRFPSELLGLTKDGFINVHPSLLPYYRGGNPYSHTIMNNEAETGVTLHFMDENFDTGDIICQYRVKIDENETMGTLFNKQNYFSAELLVETLAYYEKNPQLPRVKQPDGEFIKAPNIRQGSGNARIDWSKSAVEIERFIRALNPFIYASTTYKGVNLHVYSAFAQNKDSKYSAGTICDVKGTLAIACGSGILHIKSLQVGSYLSCEAKDFVKRFSPKIKEELV